MRSWKSFPFLRLIIPAIAGIITAFFLPHVSPPSACLSIILLLSFVVVIFVSSRISYRFRWVPGSFLMISLYLLFLLISRSAMDLPEDEVIQSIKGVSRMYIAEITEPPVRRAKSVKIIAEVRAVRSAGRWIKMKKKILLYIRKDNRSEDLFYGDCILLQCILEKPDGARNPGDFDYCRYLALRNIFLRGYVAESHWSILPQNKGNPLFRAAMETRDRLLGIFRSNGVKGRELAVASALLLGYVDDIDQQTLREYSATGAMHILSVSGMHVGIIFLVLDKLLSPLARRRWGPAVKAPLIILLVWFYAFITGLSPAVLRASAMLSMVVLGQSFRRIPEILNILAASALFLLACDPVLIFDAGFQLSYMAVAGIVILNRPVYDLYVTSNYILDKIWSLLAVSFSAQLATFPLGFLYFHQFPNLFMITNLVVVPLSSLIIYLGIVLLFLGSVPVISMVLAKGFIFLVWLLNTCIHWIERIPYSVSRGVTITVPETILIYLVIVSVIILLINKKKTGLMIFLSCSVILIALFTYDKFIRLSDKKIVIYDLGNSPAFEIISHGESIFLSLSDQPSDPSVQESLERNLLNAGVTRKLSIRMDPSEPGSKSFRWKPYFFKMGRFIQSGGKRIAVISTKLPKNSSSVIAVDYLVVTGNPNIRISDLLRHFKPGEVILDSSVPKWKVKRLSGEAVELKISCYSLSECGARVIDL